MIYAVVPLFGNLVHQWIGPDHLLNILLPKLSDVRELRAIVIVSDQTEAAKAYLEHDPGVPLYWHTEPQRTGPLPVVCHQVAMCRDAGSCFANLLPDASVLLGIDPAYPFLDREKIEAVLYSACRDREQCRSAFTTSGAWRLYDQGMDPTLVPQSAYVDACVAVPAERSQGLILPGPVVGFPLTAFEAIDVCEEEGRRLANAVVLGLA